MKNLVALFFILPVVLAGCSSTGSSDTTPSQFHPLGKEYLIQGCEDLKQEVEEWNEEHPESKIIADC